MKRSIAVILLAVLMLAACGNRIEMIPPTAGANQTQQTPAETPVYTGIYWRTWSEEIGGTVVEMNSYIVLNEDHSGYWIAQDVGTLTWDEGRLVLTVGAAYGIALTQKNGIPNLLVYEFQDDNGEWIPTAYEKIKKLPAKMEEMIANI